MPDSYITFWISNNNFTVSNKNFLTANVLYTLPQMRLIVYNCDLHDCKRFVIAGSSAFLVENKSQ